MADLSGYFAYGVHDPKWGPSQWERPASNGHVRSAPPARRVSGVDFSHDLSRPLQRREDRSPRDQAAVDQAISGIYDLARQLGRGGRWETR